MKLSYSPQDIQDLKRLRAFIAEHNPQVAQQIAKKLRLDIQKITKFPSIGAPVEMAPDPKRIRDLIRGNYVIRYLVLEERIVVLRIWHERENRSE